MIFSRDIVRYHGVDYEITIDHNHNFLMGGRDFKSYCGNEITVDEMEIMAII